MMRIFPLVLGLLIGSMNCLHGVDIKTAVSYSEFQCLLGKGVEFFVVRGYTQDGAIDSAAAANLRLIQNIGITSDLYMETCRAKNATSQAN